MKIFNKHDRIIPATQDAVGRVIDSLSGPDDALWPWEKWPPMMLDSVLGVGASGGHGPVRYRVSEYVPGRRAVFQFAEGGLMKGMDGHHYFEVISRRRYVVIRHVLDGDCNFSGATVKRSHWGLWVRLLRSMRARQRRRTEAARE